ncbi:MAG: metallophosphoesterase, partial [Oscillospiraceae bacterium]|nr:metallophosphoesterase [Oscillospiraceae bacterium]
MKTHITKRVIALLLTLAMVLSLLPMTFAAEPAADGEDTLDFAVLSTTDMHGKCWDKNVLTDGNENNNMLRVSTAVQEYRDNYGENLLVIDNGDLYQGTPVSTVQLGKITTGESDLPAAMALCLGDIGYDVSVLGNHEFNYPWSTMSGIYDYLEDRGVPVITANLYYDGSDGVHQRGENVFTPYLVKTFQLNGETHKIGVLGFENTDCTRWDVPDNYPGIVFAHPDNEKLSMAWEAQRYIPQMQAEGCEFIIVSYHSGTGSTSGDLVFGKNTEGQVARMIAECEGIDMVIAGHDHSNSYSNTYLKDKNGKDVLVVNGGGQQLTSSVFTFSKGEDGKLSYTVKDSRNLNLVGYAVDETLKAKIAPYAEMAVEYVNQTAGVAVGEWDTSHNYYLEQTDTIDLINDVQKTYGSKYMAKKYDTDEKKAALYAATGLDHIDVDVSAASPVTSNNYYVKPGEITMKTIVQMYKYDNNVL